MGLNATHPDYAARIADWDQMIDTLDGQRAVKAKTTVYLPETASMRADGYPASGSEGWAQYQSYALRANFPELPGEAREALIGLMTRKPAVIKVPAAMEPLLEKATPRGEDIQTVLSRIYEAQLGAGGLGLLVDVPDGVSAAKAMPWIVTYERPCILNWYEGTNPEGAAEMQLVVLDESGPVMNEELEWSEENRWRVLMINGARLIGEGIDGRVYATGSAVKEPALPTEWVVPELMAGRPMAEIPFVFVNTIDLVPEPTVPPLLFLSNIALRIYRGDADYRQALFMSAQETAVLKGNRVLQPGETKDSPVTVGVGAVVHVTADGDFGYAGISGRGIAEQRVALENDQKEADARSGQILQRKSGGVESSDALNTRVASRTATLARVALTGAAGLKRALQHAARFMGLSDAQISEIEVIPNLNFGTSDTGSKTIGELMAAKKLGAPLSLESIHTLARRLDITDLSFEDEVELIKAEKEFELTSEQDPAQPPTMPAQMPAQKQPIQQMPIEENPADE